MKLFKGLSFSLLGVMMLLLATATVLEKVYGSGFVRANVYDSPLFVAVWMALAVATLVYMLKRKLHKRVMMFFIHLSFAVILLGAFCTWMLGQTGTIHLRSGESCGEFAGGDGETHQLPFSLTLDEFNVEYYRGTDAAADYVSKVTAKSSDGDKVSGEISMNHVFSYGGYRFFQMGYDEDGNGSRLAVNHDFWGMTITYAGYLLLLVSLVLFFFSKDSYFARLIKNPMLRKGMLAVMLLCCASLPSSFAAEAPKVLPQGLASQFGDIYVSYNDRVCPLQTLMRDFTLKLYGSETYNGFTSEQVFTGWMFYYDSWSQEPMIKIKSSKVRSILGIKGRYASLRDFISRQNAYKLDSINALVASGTETADRQAVDEANEKYSLISALCTGQLVKMYPYRNATDEGLRWFALTDALPEEMPDEECVFVRKSLSFVEEMIVRKDFEQASFLVDKIKDYQQKRGGDLLPSATRIKAEKLYNAIGYTKPIAMGTVTAGIVLFGYFCFLMIRKKRVNGMVVKAVDALMAAVFIFLTLTMGLRWSVSGHIPLANGFETMQFLAWCALLCTFVLQRRFALALPFGLLLCGLSMMVSMLGEANPQITQLMPVLASPLLSVHVAVIMIAYALLAFVMFNGLTAIILHYSNRSAGEEIDRLRLVSELLLYPAVFLLAVGIFVGAVWANVSWGRYWSWDPKEVWALITMTLYALPFHRISLAWFRRPMFFHWFSVLAFVAVLVTYFGVNFLLGGMHSYA